MSHLPKSIQIHEEGVREGFQFEKAQVPTERKVELIEALAETGLKEIQIASLVNPKRVPGWVDAEAVVAQVKKRPDVKYNVLWLNEQGFMRALRLEGVQLRGSITVAASETFMKLNQNQDYERNPAVQESFVRLYKAHGLTYMRGSVMAAFGCNFEGDIPVAKVLWSVQRIHDIAASQDVKLDVLTLADTMAWATPESVKRVVGAVRERWPLLPISLHLHDTRGLGVANAYAGLEMGVTHFDSSVGGLGGCPFAGHRGAAGNVCTEDLVMMCEEIGVETGIDLDRLIDAALLAEEIVGHDLPGAVMHGRSLAQLRRKVREKSAAAAA